MTAPKRQGKSKYASECSLTARLLFASVFFPCLFACSSPSAAWTEDVELRSGEVISIERDQTWSVYSEIGGPSGYTTKSARLRIVTAKGAVETPKWSGSQMPIVLERDADSGEFVIVATADDCLVWQQEGHPKPPYWEFRLRGGTWQRVPLSPQMLGHIANLSITKFPGSGSGHFSVAEKKSLNMNPEIADVYRAIQKNPRHFGC